MARRICVVDDDAVSCEFLQEALSRAGYRVDTFTSARDALKADLSGYDLLISDLRMPGMDGLQLLKSVRQEWPDLPFILMTAYGSLETTMEALRLGVWDYISKPFSPDSIRSMVRKVLEMRELRRQYLTWEPVVRQEAQLVGSSQAMVGLYKQLGMVADAWVSVLLEGESGTGKELAARALHQLSERRKAPFVVVHCGAIPENLLESELFGYEKGAFTGADHMHAGLLESSEGGTLFLDEITEMPLALQAKILRFMQDGEVRRLGGHEVRHVKVRIVAATNRPVEEDARNGRFRSDLMYRFVVRLRMPPLRERREDLPQLVELFLKKQGTPTARISAEAMELFMAYDWPGNVRELENILHQSLLLSPFGLILPEHVPEKLRTAPLKEAFPDLSPLEVAEREKIFQTLKIAGWNRSRTAQILDIDRKTLRMKMQKYGLNDQAPSGGADSGETPSEKGK